MPDEKYQRTWEMRWRLMSVHTMVSLHALHTKKEITKTKGEKDTCISNMKSLRIGTKETFVI